MNRSSLSRVWQSATPRRRALYASALLAAAILMLFGLLFAVLPLTGHGLIFRGDDFTQHYPFLIAIGRWVRAFLSNPGSAPAFNWSLGLGADWIGSLNYYGFGDPLTLLAALFPARYIHVCYTLLVLLRHMLAGLAFLALARGFGARWRYALIAAAAYAYTNFMIAWVALLHPLFANPVIQLPLMILGCERRFRGKGPWVLMLATAWSALCGFYFFYMNCLMLLLFALVRWFVAWRGSLSLPKAFLRAVVPFLLGVGLALPVLLPALTGYLGCARTAMPGEESLLLQQASTYWQFPISFIASNGWNCAMTVPVAAMLAVCALFHHKGMKALKLCVALCALALLVPAVGVVFNGFSYSTDRWKYGPILLYMTVFALYMPDAERGTAGRRLCAGLLIWSIVLLVRWKLIGGEGTHVMILLLATALSLAGLVYLLIAKKLHHSRWATLALAVFVAGNLFANSLLLCMNHIVSDRVSGGAWSRRSKTSLWAAEDAGGRTELTNAEYTPYNAPSVTGTASTSGYTSIQPAATVRFLQSLEVNTLVNPSRVHGLDTRAALEAVWAVEGMTAPSDAAVTAPYGFELVSDDGKYQYWRNTLALPTAWTLEERMSAGSWEDLSAVEKQWALLQCAVTDEDVAPVGSPSQTAQSVDWHVEACDNASFGDGAIRFGKGGGSVTIAFDGLPDSETYLVTRGLVPEIETNQSVIRIECGGHTGMLLTTSDDYYYSLRRRDFTTHLGYSDAPRGSAVLRCSGEAIFRLDALSVVCQPMAEFDGFISARKEGIVDASPLGDVVRAEVDLEEARLVCFSVPAVAGWTARIDGARAPLVQNAGALWMVAVPEGRHTVELSYRTPGLLPGLIACGLSALVAIAWAFLDRRRKRAVGPGASRRMSIC